MAISLTSLQSKSRESRFVQARAVLAILTKKLGGSSLSKLAQKISRDPTSIANLAKKMETDDSVGKIVSDLAVKLTQPSVISKSYA